MTSDTEQFSRVEPIGTLGGYELLEILSRSIVTTVYRGWQPSLNRPVLIKQLHPQLAAEKDIRARFEREARVIAKVHQDNIVNIYDFSASPEAVFLVLEWVEGYNLSQIFKRGGNLPAPIASLILLEILKGLEVAHNYEVIHRDIKPENILVSKDGRIKISDFGLALFKDSPSITQQGMVIGTPSFMAPETITGGLVDARTDLFALGASFYELLTGERIFSGNTFSESLHLVLNKQPDKPSSKIREIPPEIDKLVMRMLEKDSRRRFSNAADVTKQMHSILATYNWPDNPQLIKDYIADPAGFRLPKPVRSPLRKSKRFVIWGVVLLLVTAVAIIFHNYYQRFGTGINAIVADSTTTVKQDTTSQSIVNDSLKEITSKPDQPVTPTPVKPRDSINQATKNNNKAPDSGKSEKNVATIPVTPKPLPKVKPEKQVVPVPQPPVAANGFLRISSTPWAVVECNGIRETLPINHSLELPSGEQTLVFSNPKFPRIVKRVNVVPSETTKIHINLWSEVGAIRIGSILPWADIYIEGVKVASTPIADPIPVKPGDVTVKLVNPKYPPHQIQLHLEPNESSPRIQWDFENPTP